MLTKIKFIRWKCAQTCSLINSWVLGLKTRLNAKPKKKYNEAKMK